MPHSSRVNADAARKTISTIRSGRALATGASSHPPIERPTSRTGPSGTASTCATTAGNLIIEIDSRPWRLIVSASRQVEGPRLNSCTQQVR